MGNKEKEKKETKKRKKVSYDLTGKHKHRNHDQFLTLFKYLPSELLKGSIWWRYGSSSNPWGSGVHTTETGKCSFCSETHFTSVPWIVTIALLCINLVLLQPLHSLGKQRKTEKIGITDTLLYIKFSLPLTVVMLFLTQIYVQIYWALHVVYHIGYLTSLTATSEIQKSTNDIIL